MSAVTVDFDPAVWLELPWDSEDDLEDWALLTAQDCFAQADLRPDERDVTLLSTALLSLAGWAREAGGMAFVHLPQPERGPSGLVLLQADDAGDGSELSLRERLRAEDETLVEPATVTHLATPLGGALRVRRFSRSRDPEQPPGTLVASLGYAWHLPQIDTDLWLTCADLDLGALVSLEEDLDALACAVRLSD